MKRIGTSTKVTTCSRCGKSDLQETVVFEDNGSVVHLGSECANRASWVGRHRQRPRKASPPGENRPFPACSLAREGDEEPVVEPERTIPKVEREQPEGFDPGMAGVLAAKQLEERASRETKRKRGPRAPIVPGPKLHRPPLVVAYGMGVDSTAMLVGMWQKGIRPDLILFSDLGDEWPETTAYLPIMQEWLRAHDFPEIQIVRYVHTQDRYRTLWENCVANKTIPGISMNCKSCSSKWKKQVQDKFCSKWQPAIDCWERGEKVTKAIGYDAGKRDCERAWKMKDNAEYHFHYYLQEWGWDRKRCIEEIEDAGLPVPHKSACIFCISTKPYEIDRLIIDYPDLAAKIVYMEEWAMPYLLNCGGLWRSPRIGQNIPASMAAYIRGRLPVLQPGMVIPETVLPPPEEIERIKAYRAARRARRDAIKKAKLCQVSFKTDDCGNPWRETFIDDDDEDMGSC